jgi:predicted thioesterase
MSNWTAAALIVGTGAATVALAHHAFPVSAPAASVASTTGIGGTAVTNGASGPQVSHSVATTSGSGVVVTTQTKTVNGKVVVTQVRRTVPYHDN